MERAVCQMCGAEFNTETELARHNAEVHGMSPDAQGNEGNEDGMAKSELTCPACNMSFLSEEEMEQHAKEAHGSM